MILGAVLSSCHGLQVGSGNSGHVESAGQAQADDAEPGEDSEAVGQCRRSGQPSSWHPYLVSTSEVLQHSRSHDEVPGIDGCDHSAPCDAAHPRTPAPVPKKRRITSPEPTHSTEPKDAIDKHAQAASNEKDGSKVM